MDIETFIKRWKASGGSERANYQLFATDLAELLGVQKPDPAQAASKNNSYCIEHPVTFVPSGTQSRGMFGLYRAGHFVMEAKQGTNARHKILPKPQAKGFALRCRIGLSSGVC